ncbi:MAG: ABC transporter ATP-binding protein [Arcobacteraceae bacterium]
MNIIEIKGLSKSYGKQVALEGVNLNVKRGEVYGFIGPNGAGKSTTIRILLGMIKKDGGVVKILGKDPWDNAVEIHKKIAYIPGDVNLWPNLTGGEVIDFLGRLNGQVDSNLKQELLEKFQLNPKKKCHSYSKGNRQKVALVSAFLSDAEVLILDEPTSGLDPLMEQVFQSCILESKKQGKTIFLSSHILAEVEALCDRVGIIRQGKIVEEGTLDELRHLTRSTVTVQLDNQDDIKDIEGIYDLLKLNEKWKFSVDTNAMVSVMQRLASMGIKSLVAEPPTLEELFIRHYGEIDDGKGLKLYEKK